MTALAKFSRSGEKQQKTLLSPACATFSTQLLLVLLLPYIYHSFFFACYTAKMSATAVKLEFEQSTTDAIESWQKSVRENAVNIIQKTLPQKILSLNAKLAEVNSNKDHLFSKSHYFDPTAIGIDVNVHAASSSSSSSSSAEDGPSKKRKTGPTADGVNGDASTSSSTARTRHKSSLASYTLLPI